MIASWVCIFVRSRMAPICVQMAEAKLCAPRIEGPCRVGRGGLEVDATNVHSVILEVQAEDRMTMRKRTETFGQMDRRSKAKCGICNEEGEEGAITDASLMQ